ncbi:helix-turn-helix domain-containing protein [Vallitalea maricola]|uniref:Uncharacterized protein n=1 Tax=Vallitalea maricola TaxID=3074433 RepID=A0ACB5UR65_9FIRM|nr:hypothetical protein AN2V17_42900 [Vallitalea sp. AN17-2]
MNIGYRIKQLRKSKSMTGNQLAEITGISQSIISRYERNNIEPPISSLKIICDAFGISLSDFFITDKNPIVLQDLLNCAMELSPEKLETLIQVAKYMK